MASRVNVSPYRSPVVGRVLSRSVESQVLSTSFGWGFLNLLLVLFLLYDIQYGSWLTYWISTHTAGVVESLAVLGEYALCCVCSISFLFHFFRFVTVPTAEVKMTSAQSKLLKQEPGSGVLVSDAYKGSPAEAGSSSPLLVTNPGLQIAPLGSLGSGYVMSRQQLGQHRAWSGMETPGVSTVRPRRTAANTMSSSPQRLALSGDGSISDMQTLTEFLQQQNSSSPGGNISDAMDSLSFSANGSSIYSSSFLGSSPVHQTATPVAPHPDLTTRDFSPLSARYQVASRSPPSQRHSNPTSAESTPKKSMTDVWVSAGVDRSRLDLWTERCRRWLSRSIVQPLSSEIGALNKILRDSGCAHLQLGLSDNNALQKVGLGSAVRQLPNLSLVLRYLDLSPNQEYIVWRIKELARGSCLSLFRWDGGGRESGDWDSSLPTDAAIVFHLFGVFLDSCLPPSPRIPDRRTFTLQYVKPLSATKPKPDRSGTSSKKSASPPRAWPKSSWLPSILAGHAAEAESATAASSPDTQHLCDSLHFVHAGDKPPHYQLFVLDGSVDAAASAGRTVDVGAGRNNLFHSILYFLYTVKTADAGMLGSVNLPLIGLDILGVVSDV